jgi:neutral amino acid transport system substrate-binding protein
MEASTSGRSRLKILLVVLLPSVLALAACSSSSSGKSGSGGSVNLAVIGPMTGARADVGKGMVTGAKLALEVINANGGVLGHHVNLVAQDDAGDPADAVPAAQKVIQSDHAVAIVGPTSLTASVVLPLVSRSNLPMLMWGGGSAFDAEADPHFFRMSPSDTQQADAMALYAHSKGWNTVGVAIGNTSADQSLLPALKAATTKLGMTITTTVTIAVNSTSFRSEIQKLYAGHPQAVLSQFDIPSTGVMFGELKQQNLLSTPWVASNLWYAQEFVTTVGAKTASGPIYIVNPSAGGTGEPAFLAKLKASTGRTTPNNGEEVMWDATISWALGAEKAGTLKMPKVGAAIPTVANGPGTVCGDFVSCENLIKAGKPTDWQGAASTVDFDQFHNVFGGFDILHYNADGTPAKVATVTSSDIKNGLSG